MLWKGTEPLVYKVDQEPEVPCRDLPPTVSPATSRCSERDEHQMALWNPHGPAHPQTRGASGTAGHMSMLCSPHTSTLRWPPKSPWGNTFVKALLELVPGLVQSPHPALRAGSYHCRWFPYLASIYYWLEQDSYPSQTTPTSHPPAPPILRATLYLVVKAQHQHFLCKAFLTSTHPQLLLSSCRCLPKHFRQLGQSLAVIP